MENSKHKSKETGLIREEGKKEKIFLYNSSQEEKLLELEEIANILPMRGGRILLLTFKNGEKAIFKPANKEEEIIPGSETSLPVDAGTQYKRERAAYLVSRFLDLDLVPATALRVIDDEIGSIQQFIPETKSAFEVCFSGGGLKGYNSELMKLWIFDFIVRHCDRQPLNVLLKDKKIYAIDNSFSFSFHNRPLYFREFYDAEIPEDLRNKFKNFLQDINKKENLRGLLNELLTEEEAESCFKRIEYIGALIADKGIISKSEERKIEA